MKANEAPDKLWWSKGAVWQTNPDSKRYIEYTRTDAFIEQVEKYLQEHLIDYWSQSVTDESKFIEDFKKAMEDKA